MPAAWLAPGQVRAKAVRLHAGDGKTGTLPLREVPDMCPEVLAIPGELLADLGLRPGDGLTPEWLDPC